MDQDTRRDAILAKVDAAMPLTEVALDPAISDVDSPVFRLRAKNFTAERFRKIYNQRHTIHQPPLDVLNTIMYPKPEFEAPIFLSFFLMTGADKFVAHLNVYTPRTDADYLATWVDPLTEILRSYADFDSKGAYPDWMLPYKHDCAIHGMHAMDRLADLTDCMLAYLDVYLKNLATTAPVDKDRAAAAQEFYDGFIDDLRTKDRAAEMLKHFMDEADIKRHFHEVTT